jgi:DNA polymerase-4
MQVSQTLKYLFLDLNSYFASVEQQENPSLRGRPVAVVPMDTPYTCAIAASPEAKAYGVKTGTIIRDAKRMCPGLVCVLARHDKYVEYHNRIIAEVVKHTPINKVWSIDELDSRLPPNKQNESVARDVALRIKNGLQQSLGERITCSIGIAPNSLLGKIASDMQKPDGLVILRPDELPGRLLDLNLTDLPGIGANIEKRLNLAGITSVSQFWNMPPKQARKIWGSVEGEKFWYRLQGYEVPYQPTGKAMIGHSRVLDPDLRSAEKARLMARRLLVKAVGRLRKANLYAGVLSIGVTVQGESYEHRLRWREERRVNYTQDPFVLSEILEELWCEMRLYFAAIGYKEPRFKKVSALLLSLREKHEITEDLFASRAPESALKLEKQENLTKALEGLRDKYQREIVTMGLSPKTLAGYVGTKIAFNRVPNQDEFWG